MFFDAVKPYEAGIMERKHELPVICILVLPIVLVCGCSFFQREPSESPHEHQVRTGLQLAEQYENRGDLTDAVQAYAQVLSIDPHNQDALLGKSRATDKAHALAEAHYQIGLKARREGDMDEARREFNITLRLQPDHPGAINALKPEPYRSADSEPTIGMDDRQNTSLSSAPQGKKTDQPVIVRAHKPGPEMSDDMAGHRSRGIDFFNAGEYSAAIAELTEVLDLYPDDSSAHAYLSKSYLQLGIGQFEQGKYLEAKKQFEASLKHNEDYLQCREYIGLSEKIYLEVHYSQGLTHFNEGRYPEAMQQWELVRAIDPDYKEVETYLGKTRSLLEHPNPH